MNKKRIMLSILIAVICIGIVGVTYAAFTYSRIGTTNSKQIVGDIYMHYRESNVLTLSNAMPSNTYDSTKYFEFTIDGKNTYTKKDIYYEIDLTHGDNPNIEGRTIRLNDKFLKFRLVEVVNNEEIEIFTNKSYNDLTNKRIHVETIPKNTTNEITKTYRIYMWIDNNLKIGNNNADYSLSDWNKIYASIKVNVAGDFEEKYTTTPAECFTTTLSNNEITITGYDINCPKDVVIPSTINGNNVKVIGSGAFAGKEITNVIIPEGITAIGNYSFIANNLSDILFPNSLTTIGDYAFSGTGVSNLNHVHNEITKVVIPENVTTIGKEAFSKNQLTYIEINAQELNLIANGAFVNNAPEKTVKVNCASIANDALWNLNIVDLELGENLTTIGAYAFEGNQLTSVDIPNSVETIGTAAFSQNQLTSITIGSGITSIGTAAFAKDSSYNPNLSSIKINKSCNDIKNNLLSGSTNYYPWLSGTSPYTASGVTIYGSGNEVCDVF